MHVLGIIYQDLMIKQENLFCSDIYCGMNHSKKKYVPIDCGYVDIIEHFATLRKPVEIIYLLDNIEVKLKAVIKTWENTGEAEYMILKNGLRIRLDHIVSVDSQVSSGYCGIKEEE